LVLNDGGNMYGDPLDELDEQGDEIARLTAEIERLRLTDAEREAVEVAAAAYAEDHGERFAATLRSLLARQNPPSTDRP
jgi:uncharacterized small protein (DUF1192 family)